MRVLSNQLSNVHRRRGFTLVELLVVIVIIGIIGTMVTVALAGAQRQAKETRAKSMIDALNLLILQIYEEESQRRVDLPAGFTDLDARALSSLMWKRDWLRCAMPDRREDLINPRMAPSRPAPMQNPPVAVPYPVYLPPAAPTYQYVDNNRNVPSLSSNSNATGIRSQQILSYQRYIARSIAVAKSITVTRFEDLVDDDVTNGEWTAQHQSAECLYLILSTHVVNGIPASDILRQRDIGDVDEDGMPEVLDPWGNPVGFMRWPVGLSLTPKWNEPVESPESTTIRSQWDKLAAMKDKLGKDNLDILYSDPRYLDNSTQAMTSFPQAEDPFPLYPIVVFAGADGVFDLFGLDDDATLSPKGPPVINYSPGGLPNSSPSFVNPYPNTTPPFPNPTFPTNMSFVDPYMDGETIGKKLGARVDFNGDRIDDSADNVLPAFVISD